MDSSIFNVCGGVYLDRTEDRRLTMTRETYDTFPAPCFESREKVDRRREELRFNLRMAAGLYPWPERTPLNAKYEHVGDYEGYSVKKVMFESRPGLWSTGNLYLPRPLKGPAPAILNFIGHWDDQRLTRNGTDDYPQQLANFARMGFVCLVTDMIGKVDSRQLSHEYGTGEKELFLSNGLGVQLWNNLRAVDLVCSMPEVDANRIGVTGSSGGASQSLFASLLDERIRAIAPINMISLIMQGGCQCENAPGLRRHTENVEMCAMLAPRALFLAGSTGDWSCNLLTTELPVMKQVYGLYGAADKVEHFYQVAGHQYNGKTRHEVYSFFARHLMGKELVWDEQPIEVEDLQALTWFRGNGKAPGFEDDAAFFSHHREERTRRIAALPRQEKLNMLRWMTGVVDRPPQKTRQRREIEMEGCLLEKGILSDGFGARIPYALLVPHNWDEKKIVLTISGEGKGCLTQPEVWEQVRAGTAVLSGDLFLSGEFEAEGKPANCAVRYKSTFHDTDDACKVQDVCMLARLAVSLIGEDGEATLWAQTGAAVYAACALPMMKGMSRAVLDGCIRSVESDEDYMKACYIPGIRSIGGWQGCLSLTDTPVCIR